MDNTETKTTGAIGQAVGAMRWPFTAAALRRVVLLANVFEIAAKLAASVDNALSQRDQRIAELEKRLAAVERTAAAKAEGE
jgi:hypothetical protein